MIFSFSFIEILVFEHRVLFRTDYLCVTSDFRVHDTGWDPRGGGGGGTLIFSYIRRLESFLGGSKF